MKVEKVNLQVTNLHNWRKSGAIHGARDPWGEVLTVRHPGENVNQVRGSGVQRSHPGH